MLKIPAKTAGALLSQDFIKIDNMVFKFRYIVLRLYQLEGIMKRTIKSLAVIFLYSWFLLCAFRAGADEIPTMNLKDSIPIAEKALTQTKVDLGQYYLYQVEYSLSSKGSYWFLTYRMRSSDPSELFVKVYMDGTSSVENLNRSDRSGRY